ncbi:hypothetical protein MSG28_006382 [Choristoneura fumiferana]|uniref:Uncharacterized protein n=1 Tax=Choristoneura fumiferana TaxID=7141 RepID=A0ACC0JEX8_CHOFU|nr:hypothetical protein MSG28_006382 [Choristoneura fumiferana]
MMNEEEIIVKKFETGSGEKPTAPGTPTASETPDEKKGGKLAVQKGTKEILHALETSMNLKILILPNGPNNKNCFCTCDNTANPRIIPTAALPPQIANIATKN